jgi:hypothetical protein
MESITAEQLWDAHRAFAGGRSTITGQPLPATLAACAEGPQGTHYGLACYVQLVRGGHAEDVPVPPALSTERALELRRAAVTAAGSR